MTQREVQRAFQLRTCAHIGPCSAVVFRFRRSGKSGSKREEDWLQDALIGGVSICNFNADQWTV